MINKKKDSYMKPTSYIIDHEEFERNKKRISELESRLDECLGLLGALSTTYFLSQSPDRAYEGVAVRARQMVNDHMLPRINELSQRTGAPKELCKEALFVNYWNSEAAIEWMRKTGGATLPYKIRKQNDTGRKITGPGRP